MSHIAHIVKNTFIKVFKNLAAELGTMVENIQIGIYYEGGTQKYRVYKDMVAVKEFAIGEYCGMIIDMTGGTQMIETTIAQGGAKYAQELKCNIDEIKIIMKHKNESLPDAVLMKGAEKVRGIDIAKEFLS